MPEVIPELVYVIGLFFAVVGYVTARGLLATWTHSLGFVFQWLASHLRFHVSVPFKTFVLDLGGPFRAVDSWAVTALQNWCDGAEIQMAYCLHGMAKVALYTAQAIDFLTRETVHAFERLNHIRLRQILKALSIPVLFPLLLTKLLKAIGPHILHGVTTIVRVVTHEVTHTATRVAVKAAALAPGIALGLPKIHRDITNLWKWRYKAERRLRRLEGITAAGVFAGLLANALGVSLRCVRRGNLKNAGRRICGMDSGLLDTLLTDGLLIVGAISVVEFAEGLLAIEKEAVAILGAGIREFPS